MSRPGLYAVLERWKTVMRAEGFTEQTIHTRHYGITSLGNFTNPLTATRADLQTWLATHRGSEWTLSTYFATLRRFYAFLVVEGIRADNPVTDMRAPRQPRRVPKPLDEPTLYACLADTRGNLHDWIVLAAFAGLRVHEVAKIRGEDVTEADLRVRGKGGREDLLPTHPLIWEIAQQRPTRGWWFPSPRAQYGHILAATVSEQMSRYFTERGIRATAHMLRHSFGTRVLAASGRDLVTTQQLMRHSNPATTVGYLLVEDSHRRDVVNALTASRPPLHSVPDAQVGQAS